MTTFMAQVADKGGVVQKVIDYIVGFGSLYGLKVLGAVLILIIGKIAATIAARIVRNVMVKAKAEVSVAGFVSSLVKYTILVFAVIAALAKFGVQTTSFIAVLGAAGLAVGLALQGSLANFAAGVLILIFRPFKVGDVINAGGALGKVQEIGIFTTTLNSPDNQRVIIPNAAITGGTITNLTANDTRRVDMTAGIGYGDDMGKAKQILEELLSKHPKVLEDPAPVVAVAELGDSSVNFVVRPWVKTEDYWEVKFELTRAIKESFDSQDVSIPFPQHDVHLFQEASA